MSPGLIIGLCVGAAVLLILFIVFLASYKKAPPNEVFFVTGFGKRKVRTAKAVFVIPFLQRLDRLSLNVNKVNFKTPSIPTKEFININVDAVCNVKIIDAGDGLDKAAQVLLGKEKDTINRLVTEVLIGNMREIVGQMELTCLIHSRDELAEKVRNSAGCDMRAMGLEILSFNIQDFNDENGVINDMGVYQVEEIKKAAKIAKAKALEEVAVAEAQAKERANKAEALANEKIAEQNNQLAIRRAELKRDEDTKKAQADAAYDIEKQQQMARVNETTVNAKIKEAERVAELRTKEVDVKERLLDAEVRKTADAQRYAEEQKAQAAKVIRERQAEAKLIEEENQAKAVEVAAKARLTAAQADAEAEIAKANAHKEAELARAMGLEAVGLAEAKAIDERAQALKKLEEAGQLELILNSGVLPELVKAQAAPIAEGLSKIDKITMFGQGNEAKLVEGLMTTMEKIGAGTGLDLKAILSGLLGGKMAGMMSNKQTRETDNNLSKE